MSQLTEEALKVNSKLLKEIIKQNKLLLEFTKKQAEYECYVMCSCQDDAKKVLEKIKEEL